MNASARHEDAHMALDAAQNLAKRLRRHKRKLRDHHITAQEEAQRQEAQSRVFAGYDLAARPLEDIAEADDEQPLIIAAAVVLKR